MSRRKYDAKRPDIAFAIHMGWSYCGHTGSGHLQFTHPECNFRLTMPNSPSEFRSTRNSISWIRRNTPRKDITS
jgi:hypothetical protein